MCDVIEGRMDGKRPKGRKRNVMADMIRKGRTRTNEEGCILIEQNGGHCCNYRPAFSIKHTTTGEPRQRRKGHVTDQTRNDTQTISTTRKCST